MARFRPQLSRLLRQLAAFATACGRLCRAGAHAHGPAHQQTHHAAPPAGRSLVIVAALCLVAPFSHARNVEQQQLRKLFEGLNPEYPGIRAAIELWQSGDPSAASEALLRYYQELDRALPWPDIEPAGSEQIQKARQAMHGRFTLMGLTATQPERAPGLLDWTHHGPRSDKEWAWMLNRHMHFLDFFAAWKATAEEAYITALSGQVADWVRANPYPNRLTFSETWRALEVARRVKEVWIPVFYGLQRHEAFTAEARLLMLSSLLDHADALYEHASFWGGNHLITEKMALAAIALAFPEFRDSPVWLAHAVERVRAEIDAQTYPDGAYKELTNHYQRVVLENLSDFLRLLDYGSVDDGGLRSRAELMWDYFAYVTRPNGFGPLNSASDLDRNRDYLRQAAEDFGRPDWRFLAAGGAAGKTPTRGPTLYFPWAGHAVMRSDWGEDALWAFFDIGPYGSAHQHDDRLHLSVSIGQQDFLVDSGRYIYQPGPWRDYFKGPHGHNIVLIDGAGPLQGPPTVRKPLSTTARIAEGEATFEASVTFPAAVLNGSGGASHTRTVYFSGRGYWLVVDQVLAFGAERLEALWHFHPDISVSVDEQGLMASAPNGQSLRMIPIHERAPADPAEPWRLVRGAEDPPQGWFSPQYNEKHPATAATFTLSASRPRIIAWLLWPSDEEAPAVDLRVTDQNIRICVKAAVEPQPIIIPRARR